MGSDIRNRLELLAEPEYAAFSRRLCATAYPMLGVRLPQLRALAAELWKGDWRGYLAAPVGESFEEVMLRGMVLAGAPCGLAEKLGNTATYIALPDCWSLTDSVVPTYRFRKTELNTVRDFFGPYLQSAAEFEVRFALIVLLDYFLTPEYAQWAAEAALSVNSNLYYVNMVQAWLFATLAVTRPDTTLRILEEGKLNVFTHNKTISKLCDSRRISADYKAQVRRLTRKTATV